jgi:hypothetical protein
MKDQSRAQSWVQSVAAVAVVAAAVNETATVSVAYYFHGRVRSVAGLVGAETETAYFDWDRYRIREAAAGQTNHTHDDLPHRTSGARTVDEAESFPTDTLVLWEKTFDLGWRRQRRRLIACAHECCEQSCPAEGKWHGGCDLLSVTAMNTLQDFESTAGVHGHGDAFVGRGQHTGHAAAVIAAPRRHRDPQYAQWRFCVGRSVLRALPCRSCLLEIPLPVAVMLLVEYSGLIEPRNERTNHICMSYTELGAA